MPTPRIEEMVEEFENIFVYYDELSEGFERPVGSEPSFRKEVRAEHMGDVLRLVREGKDWLRKALTEAHQAGRDEEREDMLAFLKDHENQRKANQDWPYGWALQAMEEHLTKPTTTRPAGLQNLDDEA